ncbi:DUF2799 domain-containing protein [Aliikangiella sp. IMCC44632]
MSSNLYLRFLVPVIFISVLSGCATLSQDECLNANWNIIGMADGAKGRLPSYISQHREACAEYSVVPNLEAYLKGHTQGVKEYCNYHNGFRVGESGGRHNGVCKGQLAAEFNKGVVAGKAVYKLSLKIKSWESKRHQVEDEISLIESQIETNEERVIEAKISRSEKRALLRENKRLIEDKEDLLLKVEHYNRNIDRIRDQLENLKYAKSRR